MYTNETLIEVIKIIGPWGYHTTLLTPLNKIVIYRKEFKIWFHY